MDVVADGGGFEQSGFYERVDFLLCGSEVEVEVVDGEVSVCEPV